MSIERKLKIACVIGTRPEVIKMAPVIDALRKCPNYEVIVLSTAQHREMLDDMLTIFSLKPNIDLNIMEKGQSLCTLTGKLFLTLEPILKDQHYSLVIAQGDTTTTLVTAQVCFFNKIPFAHVEAGLRSYDFYQPFPEELNRVFTAKIATLHFAPSEEEKNNLIQEGIDRRIIFVTGNPVIDSLQSLSKINKALPFSLPKNKRIILMTVHRRENFGKPIRNIFAALNQLTEMFDDIVFVYPVHMNPHVNKVAHELLSNNPSIMLVKPLHYDAFITLLKSAFLVLTDSGGLQEEAPDLGKPVLVLRNKTERPLVIQEGLGRLVGTETKSIVHNVSELLNDPEQYQRMVKNRSPYGDGNASVKIVDIIHHYLIHDEQALDLRNESDKAI